VFHQENWRKSYQFCEQKYVKMAISVRKIGKIADFGVL